MTTETKETIPQAAEQAQPSVADQLRTAERDLKAMQAEVADLDKAIVKAQSAGDMEQAFEAFDRKRTITGYDKAGKHYFGTMAKQKATVDGLQFRIAQVELAGVEEAVLALISEVAMTSDCEKLLGTGNILVRRVAAYGGSPASADGKIAAVPPAPAQTLVEFVPRQKLRAASTPRASNGTGGGRKVQFKTPNGTVEGHRGLIGALGSPAQRALLAGSGKANAAAIYAAGKSLESTAGVSRA